MYVGATDDLKKRIYFHKKRLLPGFTKKYNVDQLVYYEIFGSTEKALQREKQIKGFKREKKNRLVEKMNPMWSGVICLLGHLGDLGQILPSL